MLDSSLFKGEYSEAFSYFFFLAMESTEKLIILKMGDISFTC